MTEIRFRGTVPMPRTEVFDYFVDARHWPAWFPGVEAVDDDEGWGAPGGRCRLTIRVAAGFYDRIVVARALKRMMDRSMVSLATTLTERRRRASGPT